MSTPNYPLCNEEACGRPMRPRGYTVEMAPGTVAMGHGGACKSCVQPKPRRKSSTPPIARRKPASGADLRAADTVAGLQAFYARRYARGVRQEKRSAYPADFDRTSLPPVVSGPAIIHVPAPKPERATRR